MASAGQTASARPVPVALQIPSDPATSKRDLATWWKHFKKSGPFPKTPVDAGTFRPSTCSRQADTNILIESHPPPGIFGVALHESIRYANVPISLLNDKGESYIYGYVPIIVAKCGVYLKEKGV